MRKWRQPIETVLSRSFALQDQRNVTKGKGGEWAKRGFLKMENNSKFVC